MPGRTGTSRPKRNTSLFSLLRHVTKIETIYIIIKDMDNNLFNPPKALISAFQKFIQDDALRIVETEALNHFQNSFVYQGFTDKSLVKWPKRKIPRRNGKPIGGKTLEKWKARNEGRALLISHASDTKGTHMANSIVGEREPGKVTVIVDKEYAQVHNDGLLAGRPPGFMMPQRRFIGPSEKLEQKIQEKLEKEIEKLIKKF